MNDFLPFWNFHYNRKTDKILGFIFCNEILYLFKENYSNLDRTKAKELKRFF